MNIYTYVVDHGMTSPRVGPNTEINGGKLVMVAFEDYAKKLEEYEDFIQNLCPKCNPGEVPTVDNFTRELNAPVITNDELSDYETKILGNKCTVTPAAEHDPTLDSSCPRDASSPLRRFPMQHGPDIDWTTAEKIYVMYSALNGTGQSLERLAQRGGFRWKEVEAIQAKYNTHARR